MGQGNGFSTMRVMAIVKGVIAVMLMATVCYTVIVGIELPAMFVQIVFGVLGIYFGFSARVYENTARDMKARNDRWKKGGGI